MPEEVLVSSSLTVGKTMPGTLKHFANGKEQRTPAPVTLLSASTLRIGDGDIRQIVASSTQDGIVNYLVTAGGPDAALRLQKQATLTRASQLLAEVVHVTDEDDFTAGMQQVLFQSWDGSTDRWG